MVSGLCVTTAMNPLDVISTRLYTQGTGVAERYTGPLDCAAKTIKAEGLRGVSVRGSSKESKNHGGDSDSLLRLVGIPSWFGWYYIAFFVLAMLASNYASAPAPASLWSSFTNRDARYLKCAQADNRCSALLLHLSRRRCSTRPR